MFHDWLILLKNLQNNNCTADHLTCPECGHKSVEFIYVGNTTTRGGYLPIWCKECNRGIQIDLVEIPKDAQMIEFGDRETIKRTIPDFKRETPDISFHKENIDGEDLYVFDRSMQESLEQLEEIAQIAKKSRYMPYIKFVREHPNFAIAFGRINLQITKWTLYLLYQYEGEWRRVQIENAKCPKCDWKGQIANPTCPDLYLNLENRYDIMRNMDKLSACKCPKCSNKLSRDAIWVE